MNNTLSQRDLDRIIARARMERAGAFSRMIKSIFGR